MNPFIYVTTLRHTYNLGPTQLNHQISTAIEIIDLCVDNQKGKHRVYETAIFTRLS